MGVDRTDYLFWGAKVEPDEVCSEEYQDEMEGGKDRRFDVIIDFMGGEYAIAGKIIAGSHEEDGSEFQEVDMASLISDKEEVAASVKKAFPSAEKFALYFFSHYS